jgi:hypothetical protein
VSRAVVQFRAALQAPAVAPITPIKAAVATNRLAMAMGKPRDMVRTMGMVTWEGTGLTPGGIEMSPGPGRLLLWR